MIECLEVGNLLKEGIKKYREGIVFDVSDSGCKLMIMFESPSIDEIEAIKKGKIKIGIYSKEEAILMLFKFENMPWMDAPYSAYLSKNLTKINDIKEGLGLALNILLVDSDTGILKVNRLVGLTTNFSRKLKSSIEKQQALPYDNYDKQVNSIYRKYTSKELVEYANLICNVGRR